MLIVSYKVPIGNSMYSVGTIKGLPAALWGGGEWGHRGHTACASTQRPAIEGSDHLQG